MRRPLNTAKVAQRLRTKARHWLGVCKYFEFESSVQPRVVGTEYKSNEDAVGKMCAGRNGSIHCGQHQLLCTGQEEEIR